MTHPRHHSERQNPDASWLMGFRDMAQSFTGRPPSWPTQRAPPAQAEGSLTHCWGPAGAQRTGPGTQHEINTLKLRVFLYL